MGVKMSQRDGADYKHLLKGILYARQTKQGTTKSND